MRLVQWCWWGYLLLVGLHVVEGLQLGSGLTGARAALSRPGDGGAERGGGGAR
jgi:hypothetical protein